MHSPGPISGSLYCTQRTSLYQWCTFPQGDSTVICANFQGKDPNHEMVEIQVRPACFYPVHAGCDYSEIARARL